jgi:nucleoside-diphosphate-sugar epimerase
MRVFVIGGTGFVGPFVVRRLVARGIEVVVFHRGVTRAELPDNVSRWLGDRSRLGEYRAKIEQFEPDVVVDTRPMTGEQALRIVQTVTGIARRIVALSSGDVYRAYGILRRLESGPLEPVPIAEEAPLRTRLYPYRGESPRVADDPMRWVDDYEKILVEREVMADDALPGTILRLPMIYGPGDDQHRLYPYLKRMDDGRPAILIDEAHCCWCWARGYVENVADAIVAAILDDRAAGRVYNVGEPAALTEKAWVEEIATAAGWTGRLVAVASDRLPAKLVQPLNYKQHLTYDTRRIRSELGYIESVPRYEALRRTIDWERRHPPAQFEPREFDYDAEDAILALATS